jgi:pimeloyl-[acyl-carrier protein] methyl ester esterase
MRKALESDRAATVDRFIRGLFTEAEWQRGDLDDYIAAHRAAAVPDWTDDALIAGLEYLETVDLRAYAEDLDVPVLWIHGSADTVCPVGAMTAARDILGDRPNWTFAEIPDAGHALAWSAAATVIRHIRDWPPWQVICSDWN